MSPRREGGRSMNEFSVCGMTVRFTYASDCFNERTFPCGLTSDDCYARKLEGSLSTVRDF
jgi:hypothetical protein